MAARRFARIRTSNGETLVETLCAILVCVLAVMMLVGSTLAASKMNQGASNRDTQLQTWQEAAESHSGTATLSTVSVATQAGKSLGSYEVDVYGTTDTLASYEYIALGSSAESYSKAMTGLWEGVVDNYSGQTIDKQTQALQTQWLSLHSNAYPSLTETEAGYSDAIGTAAYVWKPVLSSTGMLVLCGCKSTTSTGAASNVALIYYGGSYYKWTGDWGDKDCSSVSDKNFDVSVLGNASAASSSGNYYWKLVLA